MAFMMKVTSCEVTSCAGDIGAKAAPYISTVSTNTQINSENLAPVLHKLGSSFPSANVGIISPQQIAHVTDPHSNGRA